MVIQGLTVPIWSGWLSGMLFFKVPWGIPKFDTWFELSFLYHGAHILCSLFLWFDYIFNYNETFGADIEIHQDITKAFTYLAIIFSSYLRLCFTIQVKRSTQFFQRLEHHPVFLACGDDANPEVINRMDKIILMLALILKSIAAAAFAAAVASQRKRHNSWFSMLSKFEYSILFFIFGSLPMAVSIHLAFSFTIVITKYLVFIYDEFCNYFERTIKFGRGDIDQQQLSESSGPPPQLQLQIQSLVFQNQNNKGEFMVINYKKQMRESLLSQFDSVTELFQMYDEVAGPYILGLVIVTMVFFVQTINAILIFKLSPLFLAFDWFTLICLVTQLVLIIFNLGHSAHRDIAFRKMKLRRLIGGMPNTFEKEQLVEINQLVSAWDWKMSAWGFFVVDRTLMPGVISIMMSYIVILFQLQLSSSERLKTRI